MYESDYDLDYSGDFDAARDADGDFDADYDADGDADYDADPFVGRGSVRSDKSPDDAMPMSRRDIDEIYKTSLRDTRKFIDRRRGLTQGPRAAELALSSAEVVGGAMAAAYLAQRFRQSGALVPVGITLGVLGHLASYFGMFGAHSIHVARLSTGLLAGAGAIWAAGAGALASQGTDQPRTGQAPPAFAFAPQPFTPPQPFAPPPPAFAFASPLPAMAAPSGAPSEADYQRLFATRGAQ